MITTIDKNIAIAEMLGAVKENWYPPNKDNDSTGDYWAFPSKSWYPNGVRQHSDKGLKFDTDANWQFEAINWVEGQRMYCRLISIENEARFEIMTNNKPSDIRVNVPANSKKEAIFEALYQFSQFIKEKK